MDWQSIVAIIVGIFGVVSVVAWASLFTKARRLWANLQSLKEEYHTAIADKEITDVERIEIADRLIAIIIDATDLWQTITNIVVSILGVIARKRPSAQIALYKIMKW